MHTLNPCALLPRPALAAALAISTHIVGKRVTIPVLGNIRLCGTVDGAELEATDLDMTLIARFRGALTDDGFCTTLPARLLNDIVKKDEASEIAIELGDDMAQLTLGGHAKTSLKTLPVDDFPVNSWEGPTNAEFEMPCDALRSMIDSVRLAVSTEQTRYYLLGIYFHVVDVRGVPMLRAVATDGHRLARTEIEAPAGASGMPGIIIPTKAVDTLARLLKPTFDGKGKNKFRTSPEMVRVIVNCTKVRFVIGDIEFTSKLIDGTFPDYARVIPNGNDKELVVDRVALIGLVEKVCSLQSERGRAVKLAISAGMLIASVKNPDTGEASDLIEAVYEGDEMEIGFNSGYLLVILNTIGADRVKLQLADHASPTLITPYGFGGDTSALYVLMPVRV